MRNFVKLLGVAVILYLAGAFTAATFDITEWHPIGRYMVAAIWITASVILIMHDYLENQ